MKKKIIMLTAALLLCSCSQGNTAETSVSAPETVHIATGTVSAEREAPDAENEEEKPEKVTLDVPVHTGIIKMSAESGFYEDSFALEITAPEGCTIYYTEDGSDPDASKTLYTAPIMLTDRSSQENFITNVTNISPDNQYVPRKKSVKANVIRAAAVDEDGNIADTVSHTYFVGVESYDIPVISVITDPKNLFNREKGIYVMGDTFDAWEAEHSNEDWEGWQAKGNYSNKGREWERPVTVEYITADGVQLSQICGVRIMGAASRNEAQKSMRFIARADYGSKNFKYPLIPGNMRSDGSGEVEKYRSFILRNGGNDCNYAKMRDPVLQELASQAAPETMQYTPAVVFLDGEYWGMYALAEDYSSHYIENNYSTEKDDVFDDDNIIIIKEGEIEDGEEEDLQLYFDMYDFAMENDLNDAENFRRLSEMIDLKTYADYIALNLYIHNSDGILHENNWAMWRVRRTDDSREQADGRWRMMVYDTDFSSGIYDSREYSFNNLKDAMETPLPDSIDKDGNYFRSQLAFFRRLAGCDAFRGMLVDSLCDMRNICFERSRATSTALRTYEVYKNYVPATFERFGPSWLLENGAENYFDGQTANFINFLDERYDAFPAMIEKVFPSGKRSEVTINYDESKCTVLLDSKPIPPDFSGIYFTDYPIELTVISADGNETVMSDSTVTLTDRQSGRNTYRIDLDKSTSVTVNFS